MLLFGFLSQRAYLDSFRSLLAGPHFLDKGQQQGSRLQKKFTFWVNCRLMQDQARDRWTISKRIVSLCVCRFERTGSQEGEATGLKVPS